MKAIIIGIMPQEKIRARMLAIARGECKPKPGEPKVWFTSMKSLAEVLSDENRALLKVITETKPQSISALAETTGRKPGNLSRHRRDAAGETASASDCEGNRVPDRSCMTRADCHGTEEA